LLGSAITALRDRQAWVDLDVSVDNAAALSWYESLGFTPGAQSTYWEFGNDETLASPAMEISDWPQAQACHAAFGFSDFHLATPAERVRVGRVGRLWFRVSTAEAVCAAAVRSALRAIDPGRRIYAILPNGPLPPWIEANGKPVRTVQHMRTPLPALCRRLQSPPDRTGHSQANSPDRYAGK
jgi:hypothetical protein